MAVDWDAWRKRINKTVDEMGQCIVLLNHKLEPVTEFPPETEMSASHKQMEPGELSLTVPAMTSTGEPSLILDYLVDEGFGVQDAQSKLATTGRKSWFVMVQRPGGEDARYVYQVVFPNVAFEGYQPTLLRIEATHVLTMLKDWPAPSVPSQWGHTPIKSWSEDLGGKYDKPYRYAPIEVATVANGYTKHGPAEQVIRDVINDSLNAGYRVHPEWKTRHMVVSSKKSGLASPTVNIRLEDKSIWETVEQPARLANVDVDVRLWWPGDAGISTKYRWTGGSGVYGDWGRSNPPVLVCTVRQL